MTDIPSSERWKYVTNRFKRFVSEITITDNQLQDGHTKHSGVRRCLNSAYWSSTSEIDNSLLIGSWGKETRVRPSRDVDVLFLLPLEVFSRYQLRSGNRQSQLLQEVKGVLFNTYSTTTMRGDGQVVVIPFNSTPVEVSPGFKLSDGSIAVCDTNNGGRYVYSTAIAEAASIASSDLKFKGSTRRLARMFKQWQREHNVQLKSFLIERLAVQFMSNYLYANQDWFYYDWLARDFLKYIVSQANYSVIMPGTADVIPLGDAWLFRATASSRAAEKACDYERDSNNIAAGLYWQDVFGTKIPSDAA